MVPSVERNPTPQAAPPAPSERSWNGSLRVLGLAMALGGGLAVGYALPVMALPNGLFWLFVLALVVWGGLAAGLLRTGWAILIVPVLAVAGLFIGSAVQNFGFDVRAWFTSGLGDIDIVVSFIVFPWVVGALVGTAIGVWIKESRQR